MRLFVVGHIILLTVLLSGCFSDVSEKYLKDLKSNNITVRQNAVYNLGEAKESKAVHLLIQLLKDEQSKQIRLDTIDALVKINQSSFVGALKDKWNKKNNEDTIAVSAVALIDILNKNNTELQVAAIDALGQIGATEAISPLISLLDKEDKQVKFAALGALGNIKDEAAVPALTLLLNNQDKYIRYNAARALKKIGE